MVHCILNNFVGDLAWLTNFIFLMVLEMQELCGIKRLGVQGDVESLANCNVGFEKFILIFSYAFVLCLLFHKMQAVL
jgi:hypothetical protein